MNANAQKAKHAYLNSAVNIRNLACEWIKLAQFHSVGLYTVHTVLCLTF